MRKSWVITGANGMLGWDLTQCLKKKAEADSVLSLTHSDLDITDQAGLERVFREIKPLAVINAAAYTAVDLAETEKEKAHAINCEGPALLTKFCSKARVPLVHFSTDQVFSGEGNTPWTEEMETKPANTYAATKREGEKAVLAYKEGLVLRVQWLYGEKKDRFTPLKDKKEFSPFADQFGAPTWTRDIAETVWDCLDLGLSGLFHFSYDDHASWADVFSFVKEECGYKVELKPKNTSEISLPAKRPLFSVLSNKKLLHALNRKSMGSWKTSLKKFLQERR